MLMIAIYCHIKTANYKYRLQMPSCGACDCHLLPGPAALSCCNKRLSCLFASGGGTFSAIKNAKLTAATNRISMYQ